jgi:hypothetical protein
MRTRLTLLVLGLLLLAGSTAVAQPYDVYGATEPERRHNGGAYFRAGAGSLFGPAFNAGQPEYAHDDFFEMKNRRPFSAAHQTAMTVGLAGSLQVGIGPMWAIGLTALGGFNATDGFGSDDFDDLKVDDSLTGLTVGGGVRATYGGPVRVTIDAIASESRMHGKLDWSYADFFAEDVLVGRGEYEYGLTRFALLAGGEIDVRPFFFFVNGGVQFLPKQTRDYKIVGEFPEAHNGGTFNTAVVANLADRGSGKITFDHELSLALSAGVGLRL